MILSRFRRNEIDIVMFGGVNILREYTGNVRVCMYGCGIWCGIRINGVLRRNIEINHVVVIFEKNKIETGEKNKIILREQEWQ